MSGCEFTQWAERVTPPSFVSEWPSNSTQREAGARELVRERFVKAASTVPTNPARKSDSLPAKTIGDKALRAFA